MENKYKKFIPLFILLAIAFVVFGIYVIINRLGMATVATQSAGFLNGIWQGFIIIVAFIVSLFDKNINIYQVGNDGVSYNLGFILGLCIALGGGGKASKSSKNKKPC